MPPVRRLTAILAADVAGYSRLMGADEEGTHERLQAHVRELVNPKIRERRGRIVKNTGDGFLAEFASVVDAVRCAVEIQRGMAEREPEVPEEWRIRFRVGINLGDVIAEEHDIFGDGVNVAARLEALAEPGGICISRVVRDQIRDKLPYPFEDRGEQQVKNIARPVRVYALRLEGVADLPASRVPIISRWRRGSVTAIAGGVSMALLIALAGWWAWPTTRTASAPSAAVATATSFAPPGVAPRLSFVVLPFGNLSSDAEQEYFADGITDDLTTDLSRIAGSFVAGDVCDQHVSLVSAWAGISGPPPTYLASLSLRIEHEPGWRRGTESSHDSPLDICGCVRLSSDISAEEVETKPLSWQSPRAPKG